METFSGRLAVQQRVLPLYRTEFFETLAGVCPDGLALYSGQPRAGEAILPAERLEQARLTSGQNQHLFPGPFYLYRQPGLIGWLSAWDPAALILAADPRSLSAPEAARWMRARGRPVLGWGLGAPLPPGPLAGMRQTARRGLLSNFDAMIAYSQQGAEEYRAAGFAAERIFVARNAVTHRPGESAPPVRPPGFRGPPVLLFVGRLQERKRVDLLLQACAALPENLRPVLRIVGDGPARAAFEQAARTYYPQTEFLGDRRGPELDALLDAADLFVLPGTGGLAVQQAMARGLPVVVGEADGTQTDLVRPGNGWNVPPGEPSTLTAVLADALSDPARLRRMGAESFRIVAEEVNLEAMAAVFVRALRSVTANLSNPPSHQ